MALQKNFLTMCVPVNQQDSRNVICFVRFTKIVNGGEIMRIENVELVPEHGQYKVDGSG